MKQIDMFESEQKRKKGGRDNFSPSTRLSLAAGAGYKCSIYRCLKPSSCIVTKKDGSVGRVNLGVASHIYAAAGRGPRPAPYGMQHEEISHHSNGIWTCRDCGNAIDSMECEYTPDQLLMMKRVRETAQKMAASDPQVRNMTLYIPPVEYDEIFWNHLPDLDGDLILDTVLKLGASGILDRISQPQFIPKHLPLKQMVGCLRTANEALSSPTTASIMDMLGIASKLKNQRAEHLVDDTLDSPIYEDELDDVDAWDDGGDGDDGDDPELEAVRHILAMEERGWPDGDTPLSPKAMDQAEIYAGLRDPD